MGHPVIVFWSVNSGWIILENLTTYFKRASCHLDRPSNFEIHVFLLFFKCSRVLNFRALSSYLIWVKATFISELYFFYIQCSHQFNDLFKWHDPRKSDNNQENLCIARNTLVDDGIYACTIWYNGKKKSFSDCTPLRSWDANTNHD